jgi:asparaginyl-tRNA synthetase
LLIILEIVKCFPGSSIAVSGTLAASQGGKQKVEIQASDIKVYGYADPEKYSIGKQRVSFEKLRDIAHLRPRTNTFGAIARIRNCLAKATHDFFQSRNFLYIHTPIITASDCEGAGEMFRVTTLPKNNPPMQDNVLDFSQDFFGKEAYLTVSGQLEGEIYACSLGNIYTFGPTFRAENSNTPRHLAEFWMVEPEMAFADLSENADTAEAYLKYLINTALDSCSEDITFANKFIDKTLSETLSHVSTSVFERLTYSEAMDILMKADESFMYEPKWGIDLQTEHERYLTEKAIKKPVIVTDYPKNIKAFYMKQNEDGKTVRAMDILFPRIGEIVGGSQREDDLDLLVSRLKECGLSEESYWWYLDLRRFGTVPHSGFGLGFERIVQFITGMSNIRDVIPFPRTPHNAEF